MKQKFLCMFLCIIFLLSSIPVYGNPISSNTTDSTDSSPTDSDETDDELDLEADSAILIDAKTGEILYDKNMNKKQFPASITKLMTVLLALENAKMPDTITFSRQAVFGIERGSSHIAVDVGEKLTMEQSLYAIMLRSANEVSLGVAEKIDGTIENFAKHMTERAKELGCKNTNFVNSNGLHDENHYTTAYDMALIAKELLKFDEFKKIMGTLYYKIPPTNIQPETRHLYAQHQMIKPNSSFFYEGCEGGKTGYTNQSQNTLVTYAKRGNTELIAVVLRSSHTGHYLDTTKLFDYGFNHYQTKKIFSVNTFSKKIPVNETYKNKTSQVGTVTLIASNNLYKTLPKDVNIKDIQKNIHYEKQYTTPIQKGDVLGSIQFSLDGKNIGSVNLISKNTLPKTTVAEHKAATKALWVKRLKYCGLILGGIFLFFCILICITRTISMISRKRRRKRRRRNSYYRNRKNLY